MIVTALLLYAKQELNFDLGIGAGELKGLFYMGFGWLIGGVVDANNRKDLAKTVDQIKNVATSGGDSHITQKTGPGG